MELSRDRLVVCDVDVSQIILNHFLLTVSKIAFNLIFEFSVLSFVSRYVAKSLFHLYRS